MSERSIVERALTQVKRNITEHVFLEIQRNNDLFREYVNLLSRSETSSVEETRYGEVNRKKYWVIGGIIGALIAIIQRGYSSSDSESNTETNSAGQTAEIQYETLVDNTPVKHTATPEDAIQEVLSRFHTDGTKKYITRIKVFNKEVPKDAYNYQVIIDFYAEFDGSIYRNGATEEPMITDSRFRITKINGERRLRVSALKIILSQSEAKLGC